MNTFPQIFYQKKNDSRVKIGGNSDFKYLLDLVKTTYEKKTTDSFDEMVDTIQKKFFLNKGTTVRLINILK